MSRLKLNPEPTFKAKVGIPVPGSRPVDVEFTFKHQTRPQLQTWIDSADSMTEVELFRSMVAGWALDDEFSDENIVRLCDNYPGSGAAVLAAYVEELRGARRGN